MNPQRKATALLVATTWIWGATFFSMQKGVAAIEGAAPPSSVAWSPFLFLMLRFVLATPAFLAFRPRAWRAMNRAAWGHSLLLTSASFAGLALQLSALRGTTPTIVAFLTNMTIVFTPLFGWIFFREHFTRPLLIGAVIAFAGMYVMTNPGEGRFQGPELLALLCAAAFALQIQLTNVYTVRSDPDAVTFGMFAWHLVFSLAALALFPGGRELLAPPFLARVVFSPDLLWSLAFNGLVASVVAVWILNRYQREVSPTRAAMIYLLEPLFAALFAAVFIQEPMTWPKVAGGAIIILGNVVCEALKLRAKA